jgi:hypothetical protein
MGQVEGGHTMLRFKAFSSLASGILRGEKENVIDPGKKKRKLRFRFGFL